MTRFGYVQGRYTGTYQGDRVDGEEGPDKRFDPWGQSVSGFAWLVKRFTSPGDVVFDPCCGGGTTAVAAALLRRQFIGIDIDAGDIKTIKGRLAALAPASEGGFCQLSRQPGVFRCPRMEW